MSGQRRSRRSILAIGTTGLAGLAGCVSLPFGGGGPQDRTFEITLRESGGEITASIDPAGDVEDVIQVNAGDDVTFEFANERDHPTGVHNHANDAEVVIGPGDTHTMAFTPTEAMIGRHEVEAFDAEGAGGGGHQDGTTTEGEHHEEDSTEDDHEDGHDEDGHGDQEEFVIVAVEVRPSGS